MGLDAAVLILNYFANEASKARVVDQHDKDCLEHGVEIANKNYIEEYEREKRKNYGISSWFSLSQNHLEPDPPQPPQEFQPEPGSSLRRRIARRVIKGATKGIGKGVSTFFDEMRRH